MQSHKLTFLAAALSLMTLSLVSAVREKRRKGKNAGLIAFGAALIISTFLLSYNAIKYGFFI